MPKLSAKEFIVDSKDKIHQLAIAYYQEHDPENLGKLNTTWEIFDELGLLDGDGIELQPPTGVANVGLSEAERAVASAIILGVISNVFYDTLKFAGKELLRKINDKKWQDNFIDQLGDLDDQAKEIAREVLTWTLGKIRKDRD